MNNKSEWADEAIERINSLSSDEFEELIWSCMPIDEAEKIQSHLNNRKVAIKEDKIMETDEIIKNIDHLIAVEDQRIKARTERMEYLLQIIKNTKEINEQPLHSIWNKFLNKIRIR